MSKKTEKNTFHSKEQQEAAAAATAPIPFDAPAVADFENADTGEVFGGSYPLLPLEENAVSPVLVYVKDGKIMVDGDDGKPEAKKTQIVQVKGTSQYFSSPIGAVFQKSFSEAGLGFGDEFAVKRAPDAIKKKGKGIGNPIRVHAIKVLRRVGA